MFVDLFFVLAQQLIMAWVMLFFAYKLGSKLLIPLKDDLKINQKYETMVQYYCFTVAIVLSVSITVLTSLINQQEESVFLDDSDIPNVQVLSIEEWLKQQGPLFWFVQAIRQSLTLGIVFFELLPRKKASRITWFLYILPFTQWTLGVFSSSNLAGPICGLILESITTPFLLSTFFFNSLCSKRKIRAFYGLLSIIFCIISMLPVLFLGTRIPSDSHIYFLILFGTISFFFWGRTVSKTYDIQILQFNDSSKLPSEIPLVNDEHDLDLDLESNIKKK